ncbi:MAG: YhbY family RNA-binding protein [Clostridia bacterium]|nr:YhbY family RNA-binding protein [Clostridia bacterium]
MITSKQRATLRAMANSAETIVQIGKDGIGENLIRQAQEALTARELVKLRVFDTSPVTAREAAQQLAVATGAEIVQVIGTRFVLFRRNAENPQITL